MRVVLCGSGQLAVPVFHAIRRSGHELLRVITQPARPAGRGGKPRPTPLSEAAAAEGLAATELENVNAPDALAMLRDDRPEAICVVDFGQFIRKAARGAAGRSAFNLHASLLPALRGAAPVNWAILRGHGRTGVTTFELVDRMDAGPIYVQKAVDIRPDQTAEDLREALGALGAEAVCETLALLEAGRAEPRPQDESLATLAPMLEKADGVIDWTAPAPAVRNRIHGTWPWPGGQAVFHGRGGKSQPVRIARAVAEEAGGCEPGFVDADLCIGSGAGRLRIVEIQPAGKRLMAWRDFVNGYRVAPGDRFTRPSE